MAAIQQWQVSADGGALTNEYLSQKIRKRNQPLMVFDNYTRVEPGYGKGKGDSIDFKRRSDLVSLSGTTPLSETERMPETKITISTATLTVDEYGNSVPRTEKLDVLSMFDVESVTREALMDDQRRTLDLLAAAKFKSTYVKYIPTGAAAGTWDTDGTASTQALVNISGWHINAIVLKMKETYLVRPYTDDGLYVGIATPTFLSGLLNDSDFRRINADYKPEKLLRNEVGIYRGVRWVEEIHSSALTSVGSGSVLGEAVIFGKDPVVKGVALAPEVRVDTEDYGRKKGIAWLSILGYKETWPATSTAGEVTTVHVTSS